MSPDMMYRISTGPMDEDWLVAELLYGEDHFADLIEWGEKIILYPRSTREALTLPIDELLETIKTAKEEVRYIPKDSEDEDGT